VLLCVPQAFKKLVTDIKELEGLPPTALGLAAQQARAAGHEQATAEAGPWLLTLDFPSYYPVMTHAKNRWADCCVLLLCGCIRLRCQCNIITCAGPWLLTLDFPQPLSSDETRENQVG
jgi:hypothetical protein